MRKLIAILLLALVHIAGVFLQQGKIEMFEEMLRKLTVNLKIGFLSLGEFRRSEKFPTGTGVRRAIFSALAIKTN